MKLPESNSVRFLSENYTIKEIVFFAVFLLHCLVGGVIAYAGVIPFSPYFTSILVLLAIGVYEIKVDAVFKFHLIFALLILISGVVNNSPPADILTGLRLPVISFTMYLVVDGFFRKKRVEVERIVKAVAFVQLPAVLFQLLFSGTLIRYSAVPTAFHDIRYGTFYVKSDPVMSLFLTLVVVYLLFRKKKKSRWDIVVLVSSALTVFLASSKVIQLVLLVILCYYFFTWSNFRQKMYSLVLASAIVLALTVTGYHQTLVNQFTQLYSSMALESGTEQIEEFEEGKYARLGAILYYLNEPVKIIGDGPGRHTNPIENEMELGLTGSSFKMYAEYGLIGLAYSLFGILFIVFAKLNRGVYRYFIIITLLGLSITIDIYNHASLMFVFYLLLYLHRYGNPASDRTLLFYRVKNTKEPPRVTHKRALQEQ